jgi:[protein-PII] uridylyltransferase
LWYPLWDAGFVLGHATRTVKEAVALADRDLDALTAMLDARPVAGDASLVTDVVRRVRELAPRRRRRLIEQLADASARRVARPGAIAEMLEPDLKEGAGGLRDIQALRWAGFALGPPGGVETLVARGFLRHGDPALLDEVTMLLLDVRVALHRVTGRGRDLLALQEQDAVAVAIGATSADALVRDLARATRDVAWVAADAWDRLRAAEQGPVGRVARADRVLGADVVLRDGRVAVAADASIDASLALRVAVAAASEDAPIDRHTLERLTAAAPPDEPWPAEERDAFLTVLRAGGRAVPVFEALDHVGVLTRLLPEWDHVRSLPQRNAYHRFTVDRHLLEAVAQAAALLDGDAGAVDRFDATVAGECEQPNVLLLAALLHDMAKGYDGDHATMGAATARMVATRLGEDERVADTLAWLVEHHLSLAETATRRDLTDPDVVARIAARADDRERLRLLYLLTVADSRATGPAAWNASKAALVRELYVRADAALRGTPDAGDDERRAEVDALLGRDAAVRFLDDLPASYAQAFAPADVAHHVDLFARDGPVVEWTGLGDGRLRCTVVDDDRPGLLATTTAALTLAGLDINDAHAFTRRDGRALEVFTGTDRFARLEDERGRELATGRLLEALAGALDLSEELAAAVARYRRGPASELSVVVDLESSARATVVEVHGRDELGLLARLARVVTDQGFDVDLAKVATMGERVVDVFYVREHDGTKPVDRARLDRLRAAIVSRTV